LKLTAKTGKVTAVVTEMSIKKKQMQAVECYFWEREAFLPKSGKSQFSGGNFPQTEKPFSENKKRPVTKEIST
jgi:hypothetical protein